MKDALLARAALAAHRFVEGRMSYDGLVKAVKDYADNCGVPLVPAPPNRREVPAQAPRGFPPVAGRLQTASGKSAGKGPGDTLGRCLAALGKALTKQDNEEKVAELCARLRFVYMNTERRRRSRAKRN